MENQDTQNIANEGTQALSLSVKTHIGDLTFQLLGAQNTIESLNQTVSDLQNQLAEALGKQEKK